MCYYNTMAMRHQKLNSHHLDSLLKMGEIQQVQSQLESLVVSKVSRVDALPIANIARRSGFHRLAFRILNPVVFPKKQGQRTPPSPDELCEYGMILFRLGAVSESRRVLSSQTAKKSPHHLFYLAFTFFSEWDFSVASELLMAYTESKDIDHYSLLLGKVNLALSYIGLDLPNKGIEITNEVILEAKKFNYNLILANAYQNLAEVYADRKEFKKINKPLDELQKTVGSSHYRYNLYVKRILALVKLPDLKMIREVGHEAVSKRHYELARECDLTEALETKNENLFLKVYFGTPYRNYRKRMLRLWGQPIKIENSFIWGNEKIKSTDKIFDVSAGEVEGTNKTLKRGTAIHRLFCIFGANLYKTFRVEALFSLLFPNEKLHIDVSAYKVHNTITRARKWLEDNEIGISIEEFHGHFFLECQKGFKLRISREPPQAEGIGDEYLRLLRSSFGTKTSFSASEVQKLLKVSKTSTNRILQSAAEAGEIKSSGSGRSTVYQFVGTQRHR